MKRQVLRFPHKQIRSRVVADYVRAAGYRGVVAFSCGNSAEALRKEGLEVLEIRPRGDLQSDKWWTPARVHRTWPDLFDATSGHLHTPLMGDIAKAFRAHLGELPEARYIVPSGSGETVCCLRVAYPLVDFEASYDDSKPETQRHPNAPLNPFVDSKSSLFLSGPSYRPNISCRASSDFRLPLLAETPTVNGVTRKTFKQTVWWFSLLHRRASTPRLSKSKKRGAK
jgi:hypothetical protein